MKKNIIVITGGPGTGKTTIIEKLIEKGEVCFPEISREITLDARKNGIKQLFLENPLLFSELLLEGRKKQFFEAKDSTAELIFLDRGMPDVLAYMNYIGDDYPIGFKKSCEEHRYSNVFILPPWEEIYTSDDTRYESFEQAKLIFSHLKETYEHYGYNVIEVPKDTLDNRIIFILEALSR